ncbi:hypothetical protein CRENPOLYSF1_430117 [Crenothrix polyspora]|uniref:Uncharacterized protein n=1 Tax=Crenothrix polyspora TaxID=360316 RepID=A0A1R4HB24_9GAMM|nr:hypothetical protein CRENPOLYSF1_430117 [Crenothrix polyspora]
MTQLKKIYYCRYTLLGNYIFASADAPIQVGDHTMVAICGG